MILQKHTLFTGKYKQADEKIKQSNFNQDLIDELSSNNQLFSQKIVYTNKFRDNTVLLLTGVTSTKNTAKLKVNKFYYKDF
jgi:hypothetical protein